MEKVMQGFMYNTRTTNAQSSESAKRIYDTLSSESVAVVATVKPDGTPHAAAVYYSVNEDFVISFVTKKDTQKHKDIQNNPSVSIVVYEPNSQTTVQISGVAHEIIDSKQANQAFDAMLEAAARTSGSGVPPISKLHAGFYIAYKVQPQFISMGIFARPDPGGYEMYERLTFRGGKQ